MDVSVIIVTYNSRAVLGPCLESLKRQTLFRQTEVLVVDNASSDGTPELIRTEYPWVELVRGSENVGYSRGVNLGIRRAQGDYLLVLNPDTVVQEDSIAKLVDFMNGAPNAGIVGPKLIFHDGNLQYSCRRFYNWKVLVLRRTPLGKIFKNSKAVSDHLMQDFDHESTKDVDWILGACMMVRRKAVESVGLMDERFFLYFEDVDWCYRMRQKGWTVYYHPDSVVVHNYARDSAQKVLNRSFIAHLASLIRYYEKWNLILYFIKKYREVMKVSLFLVVDLAAFNLAFLSAYYLRVVLSDIFTNPIYPVATYERFVFFENLLFVFTYFTVGLYRIRRETVAVDELFDIGKAIIMASVLLMTSTYISHIRTYSRMVVAFLVPFAILYDWTLRSLVRGLHRRLLAQKIDLKRVVIVGPVSAARRLAGQLTDDTRLGVEVVGFVTTGSDSGESKPSDLGGGEDLERIVDEYRIREVIFLPGAVSDEKIAEVVTMGRRRVLDVTVLTDYSGLVIHQAKITNLAGRPVIAYGRDTRYVIDRFAKRILDIVLGGFFLLVSLPFSVLYFLYASLRSGAPFTGEERLGLGGKTFVLPVAGAGSSNGPSDIVNLPLFWLVVTGRMSMVGPYPLTSSEAGLVGENAKFRFEVRPGVTGYWRVGRGVETSLEELLAQDASYARNWSLIQDLKILVMSMWNVLRGSKRTLSLKTSSHS